MRNDLAITYDGNRIYAVSDAAPAVTSNGSMDYPGAQTGLVLSYSDWGALTSVTPGVIPNVPVGHEKFEYRGPVVYRNGVVHMVQFAGGYATISGGGTVTFHYYTQDYLGNNRAVVNGSTGAIEQLTAYYPFGAVIADLGSGNTGQPFKFGGKELISANGLMEYDFGARRHFPAVPHFTSIDPLCEKTPHLSPFLYCANDPVNSFDPDGRSTWTRDLGDGRYEVIGGDINDNDLNIYVYEQDDEGNYTVRGESIGQTTSITSFYNSDYNNDEGEWMTNSVIDSNDYSGQGFICNLMADTPSLITYIYNARNGEEYDFKATNGTMDENKALDHYRGMPFGYTEDGIPIYTSARDIGNIAAGYVANKYGLSWKAARFGFDFYQAMQSGKNKVEGKSTQNAQRYGYDMSKKGLPMFNRFQQSSRRH